MLIAKIEMVSTAATTTSNFEKLRRPTWNAVLVVRSLRPAAILPNAVRRQLGGGAPGGHRVDGLGGGRRLAGQDRLVTLQPVHLHEPQIGRNDRADRELDDVARYQIGDIDRRPLTVTPHHGAMVDARVQRNRCQLRAVLVGEPEPDAQREDQPDDDRIRRIAGRSGHDRRAGEQDEQRVAELSQEHAPEGDAVLGQHVVAARRQSFRCLRRRQTRWLRVQRGEDLLNGLRCCTVQLDHRHRYGVSTLTIAAYVPSTRSREPCRE
jgi:hypothetical protein